MRYYDIWEVNTENHYAIYYVYPSPFSQNVKIRCLLNNDLIFGELEFIAQFPSAELVYRKDAPRTWRATLDR